MKVVVNPKYKSLRHFVVSLPALFDTEGDIIYNARNQIKVFTLPDGTRINVKRYRKPIFINRLVYSFLREPKAVRAYHYALRLLKLEVPTPEPIAYILEQKCGLLAYSFLITEQSPLRRMFYEFGTGTLVGRENIVKSFARFTADLHQKGVYHKDYSPGNILFEVTNGVPEFTLVDINRMEFGTVNMEKGCRNFARLWGKQDFFEMIAAEYATARNFDVAQCTALILKYRHNFWKQHNRNLFDYE